MHGLKTVSMAEDRANTAQRPIAAWVIAAFSRQGRPQWEGTPLRRPGQDR